MNKKNIILIIVLFFTYGCETVPSNPEPWMEIKKNACLPTAIAFKEGLKKYDIWSEVVIYSWYDTKAKKLKGHAITAYMYPKGKNQLWTYDHWGSYRIRAYKDDPIDIAQKATNVRNEDRYVTSAYFLK
jgi:hypothetical protein